MSDEVVNSFADFFSPPVVAGVPHIPISAKLNEYLYEFKDEDAEHHRDDSIWHASSINREWCPREAVIRRVLPERVRVDYTVDPGTQLIFDIGTALHAWWQNKYLGPMGVLYGTWSCTVCGIPHIGFKQAVCPHCGSKHVVYTEPTLALPIPFKMVVGHTDGLVCVDGQWAVIEMKTLNPFAWGKLTAPYPKHVDQAMLYMFMLHTYLDESLRLSSLKHDDVADVFENLRSVELMRVVYIDKSTGKPKEFVIQYDEKVVLPILESILDANEALSLVSGGEDPSVVRLPARHTDCPSSSCKKAKDCTMSGVCAAAATVADILAAYSTDTPGPIAHRTTLE